MRRSAASRCWTETAPCEVPMDLSCRAVRGGPAWVARKAVEDVDGISWRALRLDMSQKEYVSLQGEARMP